MVQSRCREGGTSAGTWDSYYVSPDGRRFRSRQDVARALGLQVGTVKKGSGLLSRGAAADRALKLGRKKGWDATREDSFGLPLRLESSVVIEQLGTASAEPGFRSRREVIPVGFRSHWEDTESHLLYTSEVVTCEDIEGPTFRVTVSEESQGPCSGHEVLVMYEGSDPIDVWAQVEEPLAVQMVKDSRDPFGLCSALVVQRLEFLWASLPLEQRDAGGEGEGGEMFQFVGERGDHGADEVFRLKRNAKMLAGYLRGRKEMFKKAQKLQRERERLDQQQAKEARARKAQKDAEDERVMVSVRAAVSRMVTKVEKMCAAEERQQRRAQERAEKVARKRKLQAEGGQVERPKRSRFDLRLEALKEMWQDEEMGRMDSALPLDVPLPEPSTSLPAPWSSLPGEVLETLLQAQDFVKRFGFCAGVQDTPTLQGLVAAFAPCQGAADQSSNRACLAGLFCSLLRIVIHEISCIAEEAELRGLLRGVSATARASPLVVLHPLEDGSYCPSWNEVLRRVIFCLAPTEDGKPFCQRVPAEAVQFLIDAGASSRAHKRKSLLVANCVEAAELLLPQGLYLELGTRDQLQEMKNGVGSGTGVGVSTGAGADAERAPPPAGNLQEAAGTSPIPAGTAHTEGAGGQSARVESLAGASAGAMDDEVRGWQALAGLLARKKCEDLCLRQQMELLGLLLGHLAESQLLKNLINSRMDQQTQSKARLREARAELRRVDAERRLAEMQSRQPGIKTFFTQASSQGAAEASEAAREYARQQDLLTAKVQGLAEVVDSQKAGIRAAPLGSDRHGNVWMAVSKEGFFSLPDEETGDQDVEGSAAENCDCAPPAHLVISVRVFKESYSKWAQWLFFDSGDIEALLGFLSSETRNEGALHAAVVRLQGRMGRVDEVLMSDVAPTASDGLLRKNSAANPGWSPEMVQRALRGLESSLSKSCLKESGGPAGKVWRRAWRGSLNACHSPATLGAALILLEDKIRGGATQGEWASWGNSPVMPQDFGHYPAVMLRVQILKNALEATWGRPGWRFLSDCENANTANVVPEVFPELTPGPATELPPALVPKTVPELAPGPAPKVCEGASPSCDAQMQVD